MTRGQTPKAVWAEKADLRRSPFHIGMPADAVVYIIKRSGRKHQCKPILLNYQDLKDKPPALQRKQGQIRYYLDDCTLTFMFQFGAGGWAWRIIEVGPFEEPPKVRPEDMNTEGINAEVGDTGDQSQERP